MPQIREYAPKLPALTPSERGTNINEQGARRIGMSYDRAANEIEQAARQQGAAARSIVSATEDVAGSVRSITAGVVGAATQVEDYLGQREVSQGSATQAKMFSDLNDEWNATVKAAAAKDPNDPTVAAKFREQVLEPRLRQFADAFNMPRGQKWAEAQVASMRGHFFEKTAGDMSTLAGIAVKKNVDELSNASSNTARRSPDLHTVQYLVNGVPAQVDAIIEASPNLKGAAAAKVRIELTQSMQEKIVKAGVLGAMEKASDPEAVAATFAQRFPKLVDGQDIEQYARAARYYKRLNEGEARAARQEADYNARKDFHVEINKLESEMMPDDPSQPLQLPQNGWERLRKLSTTPGAALEPGRLKGMVTQMQAVADRLNKPEPLARTSQELTAGLFTGIREGRITDLTPIYEEYGKGNLRNSDLEFLQKAFKDLRTPDGQRWTTGVNELMKAVKPSIEKFTILGKTDPDSGIQIYRFQTDLERKRAEFIKAGKDPHSLLDPQSPDFMATPARLSQYQKPLAEAARDMAKRLSGQKPSVNITGPGKTVTGMEVIPKPIEPRKPGESPADWLKRTGRQ